MTEEMSSPSQEMILETAKALIMQSGFDGFSMRQLAEKSGFAKGTIYHYFRDKQALYLQVLEREMLHTHVTLLQAIEQEDSVRAKLRAAIDAYLHLTEKKHHAIFLLLREVGHLEAELSALIQRHRDALVEPFQSILLEGMTAGIFRTVPVEIAVSALLGMMNNLATTHLILQGARVDDAMVEAIMDLFCQGICRVEG